jgi:hypothetical protein
MKYKKSTLIILFLWVKHWPVLFAFTARRSPPWALKMMRRRIIDISGDSFLIVCSAPSSLASPDNADTEHDDNDEDNGHHTPLSKSDDLSVNNNVSRPKDLMNSNYRYFENASLSRGNQIGGLLFSMTRPANFPIVLLFHVSLLFTMCIHVNIM